jgi:hypothetical protein
MRCVHSPGRRLTFDLSGRRRAQPVDCPLEGMVRRRWDGSDTHGGDDATELPALRSKRLASAEAGAGTVPLTNICTRSRLSASAGSVIGERRIGGDWRVHAPAAEKKEGA